MNIVIDKEVFLFTEIVGDFFIDEPGNVSFAFLVEYNHHDLNKLMALVKKGVCLSLLFFDKDGHKFKTSWGAEAIYVGVEDFGCVNSISTH